MEKLKRQSLVEKLKRQSLVVTSRRLLLSEHEAKIEALGIGEQFIVGALLSNPKGGLPS